MRAIDADALKEDLTRFYDNEVTARKLIDEQPTIQPTIQPELHWIPVTEKLPGIGEPVLDDSLSMNWMSYRSGGKEWVFPRDVKAWIPLPEPYKEETE